MAGVLLLAVLFRWELLGLRSLWFDEGYSLAVASLPPREILQFLRSNDAHPAGYYLLLSWWLRVVGRDLTLLRLPSLVAGLGSVIVTWLLARRWCGTRAALLAAGLVALNPFHVYASNELRMYAPLGLAVLLAVLFLDRALDEGRVVWWLGYGLCVAAAAYLSYFAALAVLPQVGWVLTRREPKSQRGLLLALAVAAVLYLPWVPYLPGLVARNPQQWVLRPPVQGHGVLPYALSILTSHAYGGYLPNTVTYHRGSLIVAPYLPPLLPFAAAWGLGVPALARNRGAQAVAVWVWGVGLVLAASVAVGREVAYPRNLVFLQPLAAVVAAAGVVEAGKRFGPRAGQLAAGGLAFAALGICLAGLQNLQSGLPVRPGGPFCQRAASAGRPDRVLPHGRRARLRVLPGQARAGREPDAAGGTVEGGRGGLPGRAAGPFPARDKGPGVGRDEPARRVDASGGSLAAQAGRKGPQESRGARFPGRAGPPVHPAVTVLLWTRRGRCSAVPAWVVG